MIHEKIFIQVVNSNPAALYKQGHKSAEIFKRVQKQLQADEATNG